MEHPHLSFMYVTCTSSCKNVGVSQIYTVYFQNIVWNISSKDISRTILVKTSMTGMNDIWGYHHQMHALHFYG